MKVQTTPITSFSVRLTEDPWEFYSENRREIEAYWTKISAKNPHLWNGRTTVAREINVLDGHFMAELVEVSFASFLAWRDWGFPGKAAFTLFGSAVPLSREGHILYGQMADWTSAAGRINAPGGNLEPKFATNGDVDIIASTETELFEETGLHASNGISGGDFLVRAGAIVTLCRLYEFDLSSAELLAKVRAFLESETNPELCAVHLVASARDIDRTWTPPYAIATAEHVFGIRTDDQLV